MDESVDKGTFVSPATQLTGLTLGGKWLVTERIERRPGHTGGAYSVCYKVTYQGREYFLKAYDIGKYLEKGNSGDYLSHINKMLNQFEYERNLSDYCKERYVTKVAFVIDSGSFSSPYNEIAIPVPYLVFDMADGDVHDFLSKSSDIEVAWKFKSLHDIAVALKQLHAINVYHQDVKPSNILTYDDDTKLGDLGRSIHENLNCPFIDDKWWGDHTYLPPEIVYDYEYSSLKERMLLTDLYLLGNIIMFYFTGVTYNARFYEDFPEALRPESGHTYSEVKEHLINRFNTLMAEIRAEIDFDDVKIDKKYFEVISYLCNPDVTRRHHPRANTGGTVDQKYSLEKIITDLDILHKYARYKFRGH